MGRTTLNQSERCGDGGGQNCDTAPAAVQSGLQTSSKRVVARFTRATHGDRLAAVFCALALMGGWTCSHGEVADSSVNLALNRPYVLIPKPSYALCTDSDDTVQLTDGRASGSNWLRKSTVGWAREKVPPVVIIDLQRVSAIDEVRVHSVGGGRANVFFPASIVLLVSDDNHTFHLAGGADSLGLDQNREDSIAAQRTPHIFRADKLRTRGRYVLVLLDPDGSFAFLDEIEVIVGQHDPSTVEFDRDNRFRLSEVRSLLAAVRQRSKVRMALEELSEAMRDSSDEGLAEELGALRQRFSSQPAHRISVSKQLGLELNGLRGRRLHRKVGSRLWWEVANPMEQIRPDHLPDLTRPKVTRIDIDLWQGEYESAAVTLVNCGDTPLKIHATLTPLRSPEGSMLPSERTVVLRRAVPTDARGVGGIMDALVRLPDEGMTLGAGLTGQIWMTFHNPDLGPGHYDFALDITATDTRDASVSSRQLIQGRIAVAPIRFPRRPTLRTCAWSYLERSEITVGLQDEAMADLLAHYVNVFVFFWSTALPMPQVGPDGRVSLDFAGHDAALERYTDGDLYLFYWGLGKIRQNVPGLAELLTPLWKRQMREWLTQWITHLKELGIDYGSFAMYPFDEMLSDEFYEIVKFIKEVDPQVRIYANSRGKKGSNQLSRVAPYVDIWCFRDLPYGARQVPAEKRLRRRGSEFWSYDCARPAKGKPPHGYYRLQMWRAFERGDAGCGFWVYTDPGDGAGNAWDDFRSMHGQYGVVYGAQGLPDGLDLAGETIVPSRRWEAWREGVEDFEYLVRLRTAIAAARREGRRSAADQADGLLQRVVREVLEGHREPDAVYRARREITARIVALDELGLITPP